MPFRPFAKKRLLNALSGFLGGYGLAAFACFFVLVQGWAGTAPHTPDMAQGFIYAHNEHGSITYFTAFQGTSCALLFATSIPTACLGMFISPKKNIVSKSSWGGFSTKWSSDDEAKLQPKGMLLGAITAPLLIFECGPSLVTWLNSVGVVTGF